MATHPDPEARWFIPVIRMQLADGSTLLKPGKPIQRANAVQTAKATGLSTQTLARLAECGFIRCAHPTPFITYYYPAEIEEFIARTEEDPDFWNKVRRDAFLSTRRLRESKPTDTDGE